MKERKIALISCRVLSIYIFVQGIMHISNFISFSLTSLLDQSFKISYKNQIILMSLLPACVLLILGIVLWIKADKTSKYIIFEEDDIDDDMTLNMDELQYIALSIVGIIVLINVIPEFLREIPNVIQLKNNVIPSDLFAYAKIISSVVEKIIRLILGFLLVLRAKGIVGFIRKIQGLGLDDINDSQN